MEHTEVAELVKDLRRQAKALEPDLTERATEQETDARLRAEYAGAFDAKRTAQGYVAWLEGRVAQSAAAWVLATVFIRYCEDNGLIEWPFLGGPKERLLDAEERHTAFFHAHPGRNDRDWLIAAVEHLAGSNDTVAGLFDQRHNPMWDLTPSYEAAAALVSFWRRQAPDGGSRWQFTGADTRFLGDVYQDLSEYARKTYALLQTPEFVEEFILDLTLTPALEEFGLEGLRTIDPTCGSGHFVLGLFRRILKQWRDAEPGTDDWKLIRQALDSVHGVDKNPFAVSIARFRLLVAVLQEAGVPRLDQAPAFPINLAVGDSLIHGRGAPRLQKDDDVLFEMGEDEEPKEHTYTTEDVNEFADVDLLTRGSYHVVVGNPPYIPVMDGVERGSYRARYQVCSGKYVLAVPFVERFFQLGVRTSGVDGDRAAGFVGQITANSFMKREFGKVLIERFLPTVHLTHIIDTSGARIPGHGTPTVILVGRNHLGRRESIRAVLGVRGEPPLVGDPANGLVWREIVDHIEDVGWDGGWVTVTERPRSAFSTHPWGLGGGAVESITSGMESRAACHVRSLAATVGIASVTGEDDLYLLPRNGCVQRMAVPHSRPLAVGEAVRDYGVYGIYDSIWTYDEDFKALSIEELGLARRLLDRYRSVISGRKRFGVPIRERGMMWYEWQEIYARKLRAASLIAFAEVATHNHFVLDRSGTIFNRTAPVITLPESASLDEQLSLLAVLNSSTVCFWLKQACFPKGGSGVGRGIQPEDWMERYAFNAANVADIPLPDVMPPHLGRALDAAARQAKSLEPSVMSGLGILERTQLSAAREAQESIRRRMIALQEELDWQVYGSYGLLTEAEVTATTLPDHDTAPEVKLGERAFEIVLARKEAAGEIDTAWFERHGSTPVTEIPAHWPAGYRGIVQARIELIERRRDLALIERPECKRRWSVESWEKRERAALEAWLLDRCEDRALWFTLREGFEQPRPLTVSQLADQFRADEDMQSVARLYAADHLGKRDWTLAQVLGAVITGEHVPYLAVLRYREGGLVKRAEWERVWDQQREEDRTGERLDIAVPPKYKPADFARPSYWTHRGKLDVPKERFISYPGASPDADPTLLLGWAGWDHKDQAQVLVNLVNDRGTDAGWAVDRLKPLLAGLQEVLPWVRQWHGQYDPQWEGIPAEDLAGFLEAQQTRHGLSADDLRSWTPEKVKRGRRSS